MPFSAERAEVPLFGGRRRGRDYGSWGCDFACRLWGFGRFFFRGSLFSLGCRLIFLCFRDTAIGVVRQDGMHDFGYHLLEFFQKGFGIVGFLFNQPQTAFPNAGQLGTLSSSS